MSNATEDGRTLLHAERGSSEESGGFQKPSPARTELTLEQQAALGSGAAFWVTKPVGEAGVLLLTDGPHGVRRQTGAADHLGIAPSEPATCFPPAVALAQTWDPELLSRVGAALGAEARALGVDVLLGPGVNIKRDPRCGRNFEYFSEDPLVSGVLGAAWVRGIQSRGVGASLKHYAANNQETERMRVSSDVDERTLREVYLRAFERVVKDAQPWTVMAAYNKVNGVNATEHHELLTGILRDEWGFDGVVLSDWGAVGDRVAAVAAGLDLQMPGGDPDSDQLVVDAVRGGRLDADVVRRSSARMQRLAGRVVGGRALEEPVDLQAHHRLAREVAGRGIVLLKNDGQVLPIEPRGRIAVIGQFAEQPRFQGGGSSRVNATHVDSPLEEIRRLAPGAVVKYSSGFGDGGAGDLADEAVQIASWSEVAVLFLGLPVADEAEGSDRTSIDLPAEQVALVQRVVAAQPRTVVVLAHGGVLRLAPVAEAAPAILDGALLGQAGGGAIADVLFGVVNPSGKLAETVPVRLEDVPSYLTYPGENLRVLYGERIFVGYRGYDRLRSEVTFPFGHGLSYTCFAYEDLKVASVEGAVRAEVTVTNTGPRDGREVVQLYVRGPGSVLRPVRELKAFASAEIAAGQSARVVLDVSRRDLAYWETRTGEWVVEGGEFVVEVGASSRDIRLEAAVSLDADPVRPLLTLDSSIPELMSDPVAAQAFGAMMPTGQERGDQAAADELGIDTQATIAGIPIGRMRSLSGGQGPSRDQLLTLLTAANETGRR